LDKTFDTLEDFYAVSREIGRGAFGTVYEVRREGDGRRFALKAFSDENRAELEKVRTFHEQGLEGERIVSIEKTTDTFAVFELLPMSLEDLLEKPLDETMKRRMIEELLSALGELHDQTIVHGDVKPSNLMIEILGDPENPEDLRIKLIDFGLASGMDFETLELSFSRTRNVEGTLDYLSPERREPGHRPGPADDLFSAGVVIFQILTGRPAREALVRREEMPPIFRRFLAPEEQRPHDARKALLEIWDFWRANTREARVGRAVSSHRVKRRKDRSSFFRGFYTGALLVMFPAYVLLVIGILTLQESETLAFDPAFLLAKQHSARIDG